MSDESVCYRGRVSADYFRGIAAGLRVAARALRAAISTGGLSRLDALTLAGTLEALAAEEGAKK